MLKKKLEEIFPRFSSVLLLKDLHLFGTKKHMDMHGQPLRVHITVTREYPPWTGRFVLPVNRAESTTKLVDYLKQRLHADTVKLWVREPVRREIDVQRALLGQVPDAMLLYQELTLEVEACNVAAIWQRRWEQTVAAWHADEPDGIPRPDEAYLARDGDAARKAWRKALRRANKVEGAIIVDFFQKYPEPPCRMP